MNGLKPPSAESVSMTKLFFKKGSLFLMHRLSTISTLFFPQCIRKQIDNFVLGPLIHTLLKIKTLLRYKQHSIK